MIKEYLYPDGFLKPTGLTYEQFIKEQGIFMLILIGVFMFGTRIGFEKLSVFA
jgi:hypothetical protein